MLAWGIAPGIRLPGNQALKARFSRADRLGRCMERVPQVNRAISADAFAVLLFYKSWGAAPGCPECCALGATQMRKPVLIRGSLRAARAQPFDGETRDFAGIFQI
jgi:hypothetical protein